MHGNVAFNSVVGQTLVEATKLHCKGKSFLKFSTGGVAGSPTEHPLQASSIKNELASIERSSMVTNIHLRRRGIGVIRSEYPPRRLLIWLKSNNDEVFVSLTRVRLSKILNVKPIAVHVASVLRENSACIKVMLELSVPDTTYKLVTHLAVTNDPRLRSIGILRVSEPAHDDSDNANMSASLNSSLEFEAFMSGSEEKKNDGEQEEYIRTVIKPLSAIVDLPTLLPKHARDLEFERPRPKVPTPPLSPVVESPEAKQQRKSSLIMANGVTATDSPQVSVASATSQPAPPSQSTKLGVASMHTAYSVAADFFSTEEIDKVDEHISAAKEYDTQLSSGGSAPNSPLLRKSFYTLLMRLPSGQVCFRTPEEW